MEKGKVIWVKQTSAMNIQDEAKYCFMRWSMFSFSKTNYIFSHLPLPVTLKKTS